MVRIVCLLVVAFQGFTGAALAQGAQDAHVALFKQVTGDVRLVRGNTTLVAAAGTRLMRADVVVSGPKSSGGIVFVDGTTLAVDASTEIQIKRYVFEPEAKQYDFALYLKKGSALYASGKLGKLSPASVNLDTPRAAIGVRGTRFIIKVE